ncbi:hypothetical protein M5D96_000027, partial [Drosophila gunungcola]
THHFAKCNFSHDSATRQRISCAFASKINIRNRQPGRDRSCCSICRPNWLHHSHNPRYFCLRRRETFAILKLKFIAQLTSNCSRKSRKWSGLFGGFGVRCSGIF